MVYWTPEEAHRAQFQRWGYRQPFQSLQQRPATLAEVYARDNRLARLGNRGELSPFWNRAANGLIRGHAVGIGTAIARDVANKNDEWARSSMNPKFNITGDGKVRTSPKPPIGSSLFGKKVDTDRQAIYDRWKKANDQWVRRPREKSVNYYTNNVESSGVPRRPRGGPGRESEQGGARQGSGSKLSFKKMRYVFD